MRNSLAEIRMSPIQDIAFVRYTVTDLDRAQSFLADFGLHTVARTSHALYSRAAGPVHHVHVAEVGAENRHVGFGLLARNADSLDEIARRVAAPSRRIRSPAVDSACASPIRPASWST
jgi:hypothetical protein